MGEVQNTIYCKKQDQELSDCPVQYEAIDIDVSHRFDNPCKGCGSVRYGLQSSCRDDCSVLRAYEERLDRGKDLELKNRFSDECTGCILGPGVNGLPRYRLTYTEKAKSREDILAARKEKEEKLNEFTRDLNNFGKMTPEQQREAVHKRIKEEEGKYGRR